MKNNYKLKKNEKKEQAVEFCAGNLTNLTQKENKKIFAVSTSTKNKNIKENVIESLSKTLSEDGKKVLIIKIGVNGEQFCEQKDTLYPIINRENIHPSELLELLSVEKDEYDIIFVDIPPVILFAKAVEYAKHCDCVLLVEKYLYSKYMDFEKTLSVLNGQDVLVSGIITYK